MARKLPRGIDRHQGGYRVRISVDGKQYLMGVYSTLGAARVAREEAEIQKIRGTFVPLTERRKQIKAMLAAEKEQAMTVNQWAALWLEALATDPERPRSPGTLATYRSAVRVHIAPAIGSKALVDVTEDDIDDIVAAARGESGKQGAGYNVARTLRAMFGAAVRSKQAPLDVSPVQVAIRKSRPSKIRDAQRTATREEIHALAEQMPKELRLAIHLATWLALRQGEVLGLQRRDFHDLEKPGQAWVAIQRQWQAKSNPPAYADPKSGSARDLDIPDQLAAMIADHLEAHTSPEPSAPLFQGREKGKPLSQTAFDRRWRAARDKVKPGMRFHDLRHTGLTFYAHLNPTIKELMEYGGHTDMSVALRYQEAAQSRRRSFADQLGQVIGMHDE